ncbi:MAG: tripartite tricarboxylate transporter TctB family protein [Rhodospirillales bacterium]
MKKIPLTQVAPYVLVLAAAGYLCRLTYHFDVTAPEGQIGPEFWPRTICIFMMITCVVKIAHLAWTSVYAGGEGGVGEPQADWSDAAERQHADATLPSSHRRLDIWLGIGTTALYLLAFQTLGYFLSTLAFMVAFIYLGQYRKWRTILVVSTLASLVFMFIFMKVVYISLPIGVEPFSRVSVFLMELMHVR